jgi:predicted  nucleic acid-binding Zn-ribbon protein
MTLLKQAAVLKDKEIKTLKSDIDQTKEEKIALNEELIKAEKNYEKIITEAKKDAEISKEKEISKLKESYSEEFSKIREENAALKAQLELLKSDIIRTNNDIKKE